MMIALIVGASFSVTFIIVIAMLLIEIGQLRQKYEDAAAKCEILCARVEELENDYRAMVRRVNFRSVDGGRL